MQEMTLQCLLQMQEIARSRGVLPQFFRFVRQEQSSSFSLLYRLYQRSVVEDGVTSRRRQPAAHDYAEADSVTEGIGRRCDVGFCSAGSRNGEKTEESA